MTAPFIIVDGSSYLFRAYHALPPLETSKGEPTGAIVGVLNMIKKLMDEYQPEYMAMVFDTPGKTFRDEMFPEYKANRDAAPEDLKAQIPLLYEIIGAMGLPLLLIEGVEADDVLGTLSVRATELGMNTLISTGDKDLAQLVNDNVTLINTMSGLISDEAGVIEKFGVRPNQIIDYLALMGDKVDNIPGVPKCGPKTAVKWLDEYGSLASVMENADKVKGKIGEHLRNSLEQLPLSQKLTTIELNVPLPKTPKELIQGEVDTDKLRSLYERIESRRLIASLGNDEQAGQDYSGANQIINEAEQKAEVFEVEYETVLDEAHFNKWFEQLENATLFAFDTETTSVDYMQADIVGVSFCIEAGKAAYVPVAHQYPGAPDQLSKEWVLNKLKPLLESEKHKKVGQNLKYDMSVLARAGIRLKGIEFDTMLESYLWASTGRHDMDTLAEKYLGRTTIHFEDVAGKGKKQLTFDQVPLEQAGPYAAEDADITLQLHQVLSPKFDDTPELKKLLLEIEIPLVSVLSRIERTGVCIDCKLLAEMASELAKRMHVLEQQAYQIAGRQFNMASPKQVGQIFFEELELPVISKTPKGVPSTAESVLVQLSEQGHELPSVILEFRGLAKLQSTYVEKLPLEVDKDSGRVHTSYHQAVAATGRLSSSNPNLQNIPIRSKDGRRIRQAFVAQPGYIMLAADYSQVELRIMAHLSGDEGLLNAFTLGIDVHKATAAEVFGVSLDEVTDDQRRSAKAINFGLIYGMSAFGLAKQLNIARNEAQEYIDLYFARYPGVLRFMDKIRENAKAMGFVETVFGRRLYLPEINSKNGLRRAAAERTAINAPMQGTAADVIKKAMLSVDDWLVQENPPVNLLMQVHDELVFEVREDFLEEAKERVKACMENAAELSVPLVVDMGTGRNWDEAH